jgi:hypothetical protein
VAETEIEGGDMKIGRLNITLDKKPQIVGWKCPVHGNITNSTHAKEVRG